MLFWIFQGEELSFPSSSANSEEPPVAGSSANREDLGLAISLAEGPSGDVPNKDIWVGVCAAVGVGCGGDDNDDVDDQAELRGGWHESD